MGIFVSTEAQYRRILSFSVAKMLRIRMEGREY